MPDIGQMVHDLQEVAHPERIQIKPPEGQEWFIPNIYHSSHAALYRVTDTFEVLVATDDDDNGGAWVNFKWFVSSDSWIEVENLHPQSNPAILGFEGMRIS